VVIVLVNTLVRCVSISVGNRQLLSGTFHDRCGKLGNVESVQYKLGKQFRPIA